MVISEDQGLLMLRNANPAPETDGNAADIEGALHLVDADPRSSEVTQLSSQERETTKTKRTAMRWLAAAVFVAVVGVALVLVSQGTEEPPPATEVVPTTLAQPTTTSAEPTTTVAESALAGIPVWLRSGNGQWTPARSKIPFAFTNSDNWSSKEIALTEERFTVCPTATEGGFSMCNLASAAVLFLEPDTIDETRDLLASFEGAQLGAEQPITIDGASGIRFEFTHEVPPLVGQAQGDLSVPSAVESTATERTPLGQGPQGRSIVSIVDVDGVIVTLTYQGLDTSRGAVEDAFDTYKEAGLGIIDSIIWGSP